MLMRQFLLVNPIPKIALLGVFLLLLCVTLAWHSSIFSPDAVRFLRMMSLGTASCVFLLTSAVFINLYYPGTVVKYLSLAVFIIASFRFWELIQGTHYLNIIFIHLTGFSLDHKDGGMSSLTSTCLTLLSLSVFLSANTKNQEGKWKHWVALMLIFYVIFLVTVALSGYFLNLILAYTWMGMRMSPHTAISLLILSILVFMMNFRFALDMIYKTSVKQRFLFGALIIFFFGAIIFVILQQQIKYVNNINQSAIINFAKLDEPNFEDLQKLIKTEYEVKQLVLVLIGGFALVCALLFSGIFFSLTHQLQKLNRLLLVSARGDPSGHENIPYLGDTTEFGLIASSIESFRDLNQSQQRLQLRLQKIVESMPNGIIMINQQGVMDLVNNQICHIFGYSKDELLGKSVEFLIPSAAQYPELSVTYFQQVEIKNISIGHELSGLSNDGKKLALEIHLSAIESEQGVQVLVSVIDISEKKLAEKHLAISREKMEVTSKALGIGIWEYNLDLDKLVWDETMFNLYEIDEKNFGGNYEAWKCRVHLDDIGDQEKQFKAAVENNIEYFSKFRIITPDGKIKYIQTKAKLEKNKANGQLRVLGSNIDVTRETLAMQKIQQLDSLKASIVESSNDAIISKTLTGVVVSWNKAAERMFGYSEQEALGKNIKDLVILPDKMQEHDELLKRVAAGEIIANYQSIAVCKNGDKIDLSLSLSPIKDEKGNIASISSIKRDVSESIKVANKLLEHQKELERSNKSLETFAYVASHDLKAPLRGISQLTSWLEEDIRDNKFETLPETSQKIKIRIKRMEALLDDLLAYYRVEKMQGFYKSLDVRQSVVDIFHMNNNKPGLVLDVESELPIFMTYVTPLEQVFGNLISNAIKHHDKTNGVIQISAKEVNDAWYEFSVFDDGPGIDPKFHQRIFNLFQTLKPRDEVEGSGMGLALVKKIIEQYGGQVGVESESRGSRFYFTWPRSIKREQNL